MHKIGFLHPNGGAVTPISLAPVNWPDINTTTTTSGLITWPTTQLDVVLRIVSSNINANPFLTNTAGNFRVITNTSNTLTGATITTYTSLDFTITVPKDTYVWFRLGPAEVSRTVTVYNASNADTLVDTVTITAGPFVTPIVMALVTTLREGVPIFSYRYNLSTVQISNLPATPTAFGYLNWFLTSGSNIPRIFYAKNYPGITTTGQSSLAVTSLTPDTFTPPFTEIVTPGNGTLISVANGDFLTFAVLNTGSYNSGDFALGVLEIYNNISNQLIATGDIKTVDR